MLAPHRPEAKPETKGRWLRQCAGSRIYLRCCALHCISLCCSQPAHEINITDKPAIRPAFEEKIQIVNPIGLMIDEKVAPFALLEQPVVSFKPAPWRTYGRAG